MINYKRFTVDQNVPNNATITGSGGTLSVEQKPTKPRNQKEINQKISETMTKFDETVIQKLKDGFAIGLNVKQACRYASISTSTYYSHIKEDEELSDSFDAWRQDLGIRAKYVRAQVLHNDNMLTALSTAERYIAKEEPDVLKIENDNNTIGTPEDEKELIEQFHGKLKILRQERSRQKAKEDGEI